MKRRTLNPVEAMIVDRIGKNISDNEAKEANLVLSWMAAYFAARCVTILTAAPADVVAFCNERAKTRNPKSMARLVSGIKLIFATLIGAGLRDDDPSIDLKPPTYTRNFTHFDVDDALVRELLEKQRLIARSTTKRTIFVQKRRLAILSFSAAGAFCSEISNLDYVDVSLTLAAGERVRVGRSTGNERDLHLGGDGLNAVDDYMRLRHSMTAALDGALFVSPQIPFARLACRSISNEIGLAIEATGMTGTGLSPARLHRAVVGDALKAGHGARVAAAAGGYSELPFSKPVPASEGEMSDLIERHHPMSRMPLS